MWTSLSVRICLLTLAVVMLFSASEGDAFLYPPCCHEGGHRTKEPIAECYKQKAREGCRVNAYLLKTLSGKLQCIKSDSMWLKKKLATKQFKCPPVISKRRFKVLYEDDMD